MAFLAHLDIPATFNRSLTLSIILIAVSQFNFGFDQQGFNTTQAMTQFSRQYGWFDTTKNQYYLESWWLSLFTSLPYLGFGTGIIVGSMVSRRWGRRMCMFTMSVWSLLATTVIITAKTREHIMAARVLAYIYIGMELAVVPIFQSEITPRKARGFIVGTYQLSLAVGGLCANAIARGTGDIQSTAAFRIIYGLFYVVPAIVCAGIWFVPESPRWLALKGRNEDALRALTRLRQGKFTEAEIALELEHIVKGINHEVERGNFMDMFQNKQTTKRTVVVCFVNIFLHATGAQFATVYGAYFVRQLGFINPFTITVSNSAAQLIACMLAMTMVDKLGRRKVIFMGCSLQATALFIMGGLGLVAVPTLGIKQGIVSMMIIMNFGFTIGWAPISHILSAEIPSMRLRDITYRTASIANILTQFTVSFSMPYLLNEPYAALGSRVGLIFGSICVLSLVFTFLCVPECKGRTLEEIDLLFEAKIPLRKFDSKTLDDDALSHDSAKLDEEAAVKESPVVEVERK